MEDQKSSNHSKEANQQIHVLNIEKRVSQQNQKEIFNPHRHSTNRKPTKKIKNKNNSLWFSLTNTPLNKQIKYLFAMTIASVIVAIGYVCFFTPNQFLSGGSWGMAAIIQHYLPSMPFGISLFLVNSPLLIIGWKKLNTRFCIYTLYCMILQSALLVAFEPFLPGYTNEPLLASIFGGVLIGVGSGIIVRYHGSSGGLDIVGLLIKEKIDISIGTVILGFNLLIVGIAAWIFGLERAMYTIVGIYITTSVFNTVLEGFNSKRNVMIITDRGNA
ncbi:MAG: YitT family protein, partial [Clostridiales bacterium]